MEEPAKRG
jgi:cellulose synthase/poly-beta-1,6-N-acetylglucosamine synthase-like glycosyltransferase